MSRLRDLMLQNKSSNKKCFVAYVTAGDPDLDTSFDIVKTLVASGADIIELGVPFSDPIGDGPTNQLAAQRALQNGVCLDDVLTLADRLKKSGVVAPIIIFGYFNPLFSMGLTKFAEKARASGVAGVLTVDLPPEESDDYCAIMKAYDLDTVFLAAPTTDAARLGIIDRLSTGFVYYVSRTGVTGAQSMLSATLEEEIHRTRNQLTGSVVVGFGIGTAEQARTVSKYADGVVVGSALVKIIETIKNRKRMLGELSSLAGDIASAIKEP